MKKILLSICVVFMAVNTIFAQRHIRSSLYVNLENKAIDSSFVRYRLNGSQIVRAIDNCDSLCLSFKAEPYFGITDVVKQVGNFSLLFPDLKVHVIDNNSKEHNANFTFDGQNMSIKKLPKRCSVKINYTFFNTFFPRVDSLKMLTFISPYISSYNSWYFTLQNMTDTVKFQDFIINVPNDNIYFFATCPYKRYKRQYVFDTQKTRDVDISFFILEKDFYERYPITPNITVYFTRGSFIDIKRQIVKPLGEIDKYTIKKRIEYIKNGINKIENILCITNTNKIDIADMYWKNGKYREGHAYNTSDNSYFLLVDSSFWRQENLIHELLHCYTKFDYDKDSSKYFFSESMIEYLATYISSGTVLERDNKFNSKIICYLKDYSKDSISIFKIKNNQWGNEQETMPIIYLKTPFIIHSFAKRIGEDRFISILKQFYKQVRANNNIVLFHDFEDIVKANGVSEMDWLLFKNAL